MIVVLALLIMSGLTLGTVLSSSRRITHLMLTHYDLIKEIQDQAHSRRAEFLVLQDQMKVLTRAIMINTAREADLVGEGE